MLQAWCFSGLIHILPSHISVLLGVFFVSILHLMVDIVYQKDYLFVTHRFSYLFYSPLDYIYLLKTDYLGDKFPQLQTTLEIET